MALSRALSRSASPGASRSFWTCSRSSVLGRRFSCLGVRMVESGLTLTMPATDEELVEAAKRRQLAGRRALGVVLAVEIGQELADGQGLALELAVIERT
jgi:hypothetical protein